MSDKPEDGGPAFPILLPEGCGDRKGISEGMSLRDWFAGMALQGVLASIGGEGIALAINQSAEKTGKTRADFMAEMAYESADYMLKARKS